MPQSHCSSPHRSAFTDRFLGLGGGADHERHHHRHSALGDASDLRDAGRRARDAGRHLAPRPRGPDDHRRLRHGCRYRADRLCDARATDRDRLLRGRFGAAVVRHREADAPIRSSPGSASPASDSAASTSPSRRSMAARRLSMRPSACPVSGTAFGPYGTLSVLVVAMPFVVAALWVLLRRTRYGLRSRPPASIHSRRAASGSTRSGCVFRRWQSAVCSAPWAALSWRWARYRCSPRA